MHNHAVEFEELFRGKFLGADGRGVIQELDGFLDFLFVVGAAKGVCERLALLCEGGTHEVEESVGGLERIGAGREQHGGAIDVWLRRKMFGADFAENLRVGESGDEYGEAPVIAAARACADAFGDFQLHHSHEALGEMQTRHEACNNRGTYVVRKVACNPGLFVFVQELLQVELQKVDVRDVKIFALAEFFVQHGDALFVDFNGGEVYTAVQQVFREGAMAWTDFKHGFAFVRGQITCDCDCGGNIQKVLAKFTTTCSIHARKCSKTGG